MKKLAITTLVAASLALTACASNTAANGTKVSSFQLFKSSMKVKKAEYAKKREAKKAEKAAKKEAAQAMGN